MPCTPVRGRRTYRKVESTEKGGTPEERSSSREGHLLRQGICGAVAPYGAKDDKGPLICGIKTVHMEIDGWVMHKCRGVKWREQRKAGGKVE